MCSFISRLHLIQLLGEFVCCWDGYYYDISDEYVDGVGEEIGAVTKYSDVEGTYSGNFSNHYEVGTKYFAIPGIEPNEEIAIEEDGRYRKAIRGGEYIEE